ncbi:hypothetical protein PsYK624_111160 [Phanerochaete sordida]|uniref:Uncharacterized protein n=1 Tax=Phanerochaete sordida TaxID=48140 RepID=A0A9P3GH72_9APHY|nr:hypothetical protein PsYK624_111160 [Phanerochaete sordida]
MGSCILPSLSQVTTLLRLRSYLYTSNHSLLNLLSHSLFPLQKQYTSPSRLRRTGHSPKISATSSPAAIAPSISFCLRAASCVVASSTRSGVCNIARIHQEHSKPLANWAPSKLLD